MLAHSTYRFDGFAMRINYGLDRVRFPSPVRAGSRLRMCATLQSVLDTPRGLRVTVHGVVEAEGNQEVACVADSLTLLVA
jgi:acyl dehydratase